MGFFIGYASVGKVLINYEGTWIQQDRPLLVSTGNLYFKYILNAQLNCVPLNPSSIELGMSLFSAFVTEYACKDNIRNTINDILILATAIDTHSELVSKDSVLNRFAANSYGGKVTEIGETLRIDFADKDASERKRFQESKGFVNRGWSYAIRRGNAVQGI